MRLEGKSAVITGAASGMGLAMSHLFSSEGAYVMMADWNAKRLDEAVADIKSKGGKVLGINLFGPMYTTRKAVQFMEKNGGGSIVNISSAAGLHGATAGVAYTTSKHGLLGLTKNTAWMYAKKAIRCNAICPGGTATNISESMPQDKLSPLGAERTGLYTGIMPGFLQPLDIANLALFLASDESRNINGAIITADAGWGAA